MTRCLKVALVQQLAGGDPGNLIRGAAGAGADVVVFPEMYSNGYARFAPGDARAEAEWRAGAVGLDSDFVEVFRQAARDHGVHVVSTFLERGDPSPFNAALLIGPGGEALAHHRKVHICDFDSPESACGRGDGFAVTEIRTEAGPVKVGLMICMDREYPQSAAVLSSRGAEVALVPNSCNLSDDPTVGDVRIAQIRGRAFETVMGIAVANYPAPKCDGHSLAVGPLGNVMAVAGREPAILSACFDMDEIRRVRRAEVFRWRPEDHLGPTA